ncbi:Co2+/Mg2+ efflux protein ApaG [Marinobacterium sp. D7]|uniref:Co2+/Mg2+ efflux protein ApaG n=1 Tax=Marinobacterium ramblicola TaxID=2849041 RepID=UPI001C2DC00D|nr:Co2+/Mg2+ efflux protein ApaG [Marinobacterium ramblicola]MBV1787331.1 Co2+/Mg2+ efflux protein ApaG [Marinobacterium ramblicola]
MDPFEYGRNIQIDVQTSYLPEQSDPEAHRFVFSYQITVTNHNPEPVKLISRRWVITDGNEQVQEVKGEGVVGEQPVIEPDQSFSYTSGTVLATEVGSMQGHYEMETEDEDRFIAPIPAFTLAQPNALH